MALGLFEYCLEQHLPLKKTCINIKLKIFNHFLFVIISTIPVRLFRISTFCALQTIIKYVHNTHILVYVGPGAPLTYKVYSA